jgi:hypothetical protein
LNHLASTRARCLDSEQRASRIVVRNQRLHRRLRQLVVAHPHSKYIGGNSEVEDIARDVGFVPSDLAIADIRIGNTTITLACAPSRIWAGAFSKELLMEFKRRCGAAGHRVVLVPQTFVDREPRAANAEMVANAAKITASSTVRMAIYGYLIENGPSSLAELAAQLDHPAPFDCVLGLVTVGVLSIDMKRPISPHSIMDIAAPVPDTGLKA